MRVPQPSIPHCPSADHPGATSSFEDLLGKGGQCSETGGYKLWCLKIYTRLSLRKGVCYVQAAGLGWAQSIACIKEL